MYVTINKALTFDKDSIWFFRGTKDDCYAFLSDQKGFYKIWRKKIPNTQLLKVAFILRIQSRKLHDSGYPDFGEILFKESQRIKEAAFRKGIYTSRHLDKTDFKIRHLNLKHKAFTPWFYNKSNQK